MKILIRNANIVNRGHTERGSVLISGEEISEIIPFGNTLPWADKEIDASGGLLLPGVIDEHVHFREPGLTAKGDLSSESQAAAAGGVTSFFDMPNTVPTTTSSEAWRAKMDLAAQKSCVNYAFFYGGTNRNFDTFQSLDFKYIPGIKLFMGASTGNMLVDNVEVLRKIFRYSPVPVMTHCEDSTIIARNASLARERYGDDVPIACHSRIRNEACCISSTALAISLACEGGAHLHVAHVSTSGELSMIKKAGPRVTGEACLSHLLFSENDYARLGSLIKCNPSVKSLSDRDALRGALTDNEQILTVGTDHAPHQLKEKLGGALKAASGMPMVQFSLAAMLTLSDRGFLSKERLVELMCHNPALLFGVENRGFIQQGSYADLVLVRPRRHTVQKSEILSRCGWSPLEGMELTWEVVWTMSNGAFVYRNGRVDSSQRGRSITFLHRG